MASTLIDKADERSREAIEGFDLAASLTAASDLSRAADLIDYTVGRLSRRTSHASSCTDLSISSFLTSLQASAALFKATAMKILRWRNQWLDKEVDELDAVEKALCGGVRMCGAEELGLESILSSLELLVVLYASCDTHVRHSCVVDMVFRGAADVMSNAQSRVQMGIDPHTSKLVLPLAFLPDSPSIATVTFYDNCGVEVIGMEASDVDATVMSYGAPCDTAVVTQLSHSYFQIEFTVTSDALEVVDLHVSAGFCPIEAVPVKAATTVRGAFIRSIDIASAHNNCGLAVNEDESVLAASSLNDGAVYLYRLPDGALLLTISDLEMPEKLCFVPKSCGGGLLVPESRRRCLKLYSEAGEFLRRIGEAEITHPIVGVATNGAVVAVGKGKEQSGPQILMFDLATGAHIRSFAGRGSANGEVHSCVGLRFTPDGAHLAVSEFRNDRISIFTIAGVFVRCITHPCIRAPEDVDFALNGDMLIAAHGSNSIVVLSPNGSVVLNEIKSVEGQFSLRMPMSLAYSKSTRRLYAIGAVTKVLCFE